MKKVLLFIVVSSFLLNYAFAQLMPVTLSTGTDDMVFDGRWSFRQEWKPTSLHNEFYSDKHEMVIKVGHDYENIYVLLDFITKAYNYKDRAFVCLDSNPDRDTKPSSTTFCFTTTPDSQYPKTLQGGSPIAITGYFTQIPNHPNLAAVGGISDQDDRFSSIPHESYEFKIPIDVIGISNRYGFYVSVVDGQSGKSYNWPQLTTPDRHPYIPPPNMWGEVFSPDQSIPEFSLPHYILISTLLLSIIIGKIRLKTSKFVNRF
ncbi:MAG: hypothetical protein ACT4OW_02070 [Nitrososphaerota archaeon]